ncbi:ABC transporter permease [Candidatus Sumerlaeota bacterium]|nr:ABC transporter permease [Candidatus Sumerlaeota bacterium]
MILGNVLRVALRSMLLNRLRLFLTMLGIIIGVAAVIAMLALGEGARRATLERFERMGTNLLILGNHHGHSRTQRLTVREWHAIEEMTQCVDRIVPEVNTTVQSKAGTNAVETRIIGSTPDYFIVRDLEVVRGRPFTEEEVRQSADVCVLGHQVAEDLFPLGDALWQRIFVGNRRVRVVGVAEEKGEGFTSQDSMVMMPYTTVMNRLSGSTYLDRLHIRCRSHSIAPEAQAAIGALLRRLRGLTPEEEDNFRFFAVTELIESLEHSIALFKALLGGVAALSLLVGGIGIMNIMLVTVTERTREIGIRKALGARRRDILVQFLIESVVVAIIGGALGIALGWGIASALDRLVEQFDTIITLGSILLSVSCASAIGLIFGIYPARRAARLDPIEALRQE